MAKIDAMNILFSREKSPLEFKFESLTAPPLYSFFTQHDIDRLRYFATSIKYSSKMTEKLREIDIIMKARGCKKLASGTNRIVYAPYENNSIVFKVALDKVGMGDNPAEYRNQFLIQPFVTKVFEHSPCGVIAVVERVQPIVKREEFMSISDNIFDLLVNNIIGEFVLEDIGTKYFMNFGVRNGFGPVLLDFPYIYKLDGKKLVCSKKDLSTGIVCNGDIDYDNGFNNLICTKCGKLYHAKELKHYSENGDIKLIRKGDGHNMKINIMQGEKVVERIETGTDTIQSPKKPVRLHRKQTLDKAVESENLGTRVIVSAWPDNRKGKKKKKNNKRNNDRNQNQKKPFTPPKVEKVEDPVVKEQIGRSIEEEHVTTRVLTPEAAASVLQEDQKAEDVSIEVTDEVGAAEEAEALDLDPDAIAQAMIEGIEESKETESGDGDSVKIDQETVEVEESDPNINANAKSMLNKFGLSDSDFDDMYDEEPHHEKIRKGGNGGK